ncbi:MAG: TGS domain-containing protein, partial [Ilumatobacteraceae bacterium]
MSSITVRLPDGSARELPAGSTSLDLAASIGRRLAEDAVAAVGLHGRLSGGLLHGGGRQHLGRQGQGGGGGEGMGGGGGVAGGLADGIVERRISQGL